MTTDMTSTDILFEKVNQLLKLNDTLELELSQLRERVQLLETKRKETDNDEFDENFRLEEMKKQFLESRPHNRTTLFRDWELVMWVSYLSTQTTKLQRIPTTTDLWEKVRKLRNVIEYFKEYAKNKDVPDEKLDPTGEYGLECDNYLEKMNSIDKRDKEYKKFKKEFDIFGNIASYKRNRLLESWARQRTKDYLEYMTINVKIYSKETGKEEPTTFWQCVSEWAVTKYGDRVGSWQQIKSLPDVDLDQEETINNG